MGTVYWGTLGAVHAGANPIALLLGDSWYWYPTDNLAIEINNRLASQDLIVIGNNGADAADWIAGRIRKDIDFAFRMYASQVQALLLSGGGNDIAGMADFLKLIEDNCTKATTVAECYRSAQPDEIISRIISAYRAVIIKFRAYNRTATVFTHNYDHAWPTGRGLFGPAKWLKAPMDKAKVPKDLRRDLFKDLIDRLHQAQQRLAQEEGLGPIVPILSAGTLPDDESVVDDWWANELHPTPQGFRKLAKEAFVPALRTAIPA